MSDGGLVSTKGLVGGSAGGSSSAPAASELGAPEALVFDVNVPHNAVMIVVPTAVNIVLMVAENIIDNLRVRQPASLTLPSLYKRAFMATREVDEIAVVKAR
jgi:hypothetical protein